jgi:hypothetical protein
MRDRIKRFAPFIITGALVWAATAAVPSIAATAFDAANARKVDGFSAVKATASVHQRAGRLVATNHSGRLPDNIIKEAPDAARLGGLKPKQVRTQWLSVTALGAVDSSSGAKFVTVTHPATGTYCVTDDGIEGSSVSGNVQSEVNGFEDITMIVTSLYNTSACPGDIRIYTAKSGALYDSPFTLNFALR